MNNRTFTRFCATLLLASLQTVNAEDQRGPAVRVEPLDGEKHFKNLRQLTFGGQNAEAYFSHDGTQLIFQSTRDELQCDAIFRMNSDGSNVRQLSSGLGVTTCAFIAPDNRSILYASTHLQQQQCPPKPDHSQGYVWPIYSSFDIFTAKPDGTDLQRLTDIDGYDAEATFSPQGDRIVFTSMRDGDLDLYSMAPDGSDVVRLTDRPGYDGGAFYSPDGSMIVWRAEYPEPGPELDDYQGLLSEGLIRPGELEIMVMNADGTNQRQITNLGAANFAPFFHPSGEKIIFSSNHQDPSGRDFELFMVNLDGTGLEQITYSEGFDGFPVFSPDGSQIVFGSNRNNGGTSDTNVFIADWVE